MGIFVDLASMERNSDSKSQAETQTVVSGVNEGL